MYLSHKRSVETLSKIKPKDSYHNYTRQIYIWIHRSDKHSISQTKIWTKFLFK